MVSLKDHHSRVNALRSQVPSPGVCRRSAGSRGEKSRGQFYITGRMVTFAESSCGFSADGRSLTTSEILFYSYLSPVYCTAQQPSPRTGRLRLVGWQLLCSHQIFSSYASYTTGGIQQLPKESPLTSRRIPPQIFLKLKLFHYSDSSHRYGPCQHCSRVASQYISTATTSQHKYVDVGQTLKL
jgi:hypothetical protein